MSYMLQASEFHFDEFWEIGKNIFDFSIWTPHSIRYEFYSEFYIYTQNTRQNFKKIEIKIQLFFT